MSDRLQQLLAFHEEDPSDSFVTYSLAQEYLKIGLPARAVETFEFLLERDPDYAGLYYHLGKTLETLEQWDRARSVYKLGIDKCRALGETHALGELNGALMMLEDEMD